MIVHRNEPMLSPAELASGLDLSAQRIRGLIREGSLKALNLARAGSCLPRYFLSVDGVNEFLIARRLAGRGADKQTSSPRPAKSRGH